MWVVACRIAGGVTGTRLSTLRQDGQVLRFATRREAEVRAAQARAHMAGRLPLGVEADYWAEEEFPAPAA